MTQPITLPYHVDVTQAMIAAGRPDDYDSCPVALSLYSQLVKGSPEKNVSVEVRTHGIDLNGWIYDMPKEAAEFITRFDDRGYEGPVEPFEFTITNLIGEPTP